MTTILRKLPFPDKPGVVTASGTRVRVKADQIIVWVSTSPAKTLGIEANCPRFPAILDTGNTFTFSLREAFLRQWAGIDPRFLRRLGSIRHGGWHVPTHAADVWLYRNRPGERDVLLNQPPCKLECEPGIAVYPSDLPQAPRLPLLGLQALTENRLHLTVDAERRRVSLRSPDWRTWLVGWWA